MRNGHPHGSKIPRFALPVAAAAIALLLAAGTARALPGTHGPAVSTWDTTQSTVVFAFHNGFLLHGGHLRMAGYNANFTSTTGRLSAQFGMHYVGYQGTEDGDKAVHGISGTAVAVYGIPVAGRHDNGLARAAFSFYFGGAPAALFNDGRNYVTIPLTVGLGLPFSPVRHVSIVPWLELAPSINVDTEFREVEGALNQSELDIDDQGNVSFTKEQAEAVLGEALEMEITISARFRGGLSLVFHLGNKVDLAVNGIVSHAGPEFKGPVAIFVGGALAFAWDDPPPAVLPVEARLEREDCAAIGERYKSCESYQHLLQKLEEAGIDPEAEPGPSPVTPPSEAPAPAVEKTPYGG
jgi:hypothetical protein